MAYCKKNRPRARFRSLIVTMTAMVAASGCYTSHVRTPASTTFDARFAHSFDPDPAFQYEQTEVPVTNHVEGRGASSQYELRLLEIPSIGDNAQDGNLVTARYFKSTLPGKHPLVIVLPIWGTYTYPPRKISSSLQRYSNGDVHVLYVQGENFLVDWPSIVDADDQAEFMDLWREALEHQRVTMIDIRRLIDWAAQRPEIDADRVGLIGFSAGAMVAGNILTQEPRLAATVLVMGGAHTHEIISRCNGERTTNVQEKAATFGWSRDDLETRLASMFQTIDPASYPGRTDPSRVLIFEAGRDTCVPKNCRDDLWEALGRPERVVFDYGHKKAFLSFTPLGNNWMRRQIWRFFEAKLLTDAPR